MGVTATDAPVVERFDELVAHLATGPKPDRTTWRIGTEHEKFVFRRDDLTPVAWEGEHGIGAMLEAMATRHGYRRIEENGHLIALMGPQGESITLEPGGQFELSGAPLEHIHDTCAEVGRHLRELRGIADEFGIGFLGLGFQPLWPLERIPVMPKGRYGIMRRYMPRVGRLGHQMMFRSCTVQTNLDFASEADMIEKMRVSLALQPIATALFANSPFAEGRPNGFLSYRAHVWSDTDPDRTGMLDFAFLDGFGFEAYARWALDVPMYFVHRGDRYVDVAGRSFRDFMEGRLPELPGERPTLEDWKDHLTTLFPEVRLKTYLEMRGADAGPWSRLCALPAFWVGLLYDDAAQKAAWNLVRHWTAEDREALRRSVPALGLRAPIAGRTALDVARDVLAIARQGLKARDRRDGSGADETGFLAELDDIVATGVSPAERLLGMWREEWGRDVRPAFEACAY
jgi:glutamate--cysteine ligase